MASSSGTWTRASIASRTSGISRPAMCSMTSCRLRDATEATIRSRVAVRWQDDLPGAEQPLGTSEDLGHRVPLLRQGLDLTFEPLLGGRLERADSEVLPDAVLVPRSVASRRGGLTRRTGGRSSPTTEMVGDPHAHRIEIGQKSPVDLQDAEWIANSGGADRLRSGLSLGLVGMSQGPVPSQLPVAGIIRQRHRAAALPRRRDGTGLTRTS